MISDEPQQKELLVNMLAQSAALMNGVENNQTPSFSCPGNRPSNVILLDELTPFTLGQIMAMYEHTTFVQSILWNINCFDQPGVELGKKIAKEVLFALENNSLKQLNLDPSTQQLLNQIINA